MSEEFGFSTTNPYESLQAITADSPEALVKLLKSNQTPIKILAFVQVGVRSVAYVMGDIRIVKTKLKKAGVNTNGSSSKG